MRFVEQRATLLPMERLIEGAALDRYSFIRNAYLQRRLNLVYDGNPPEPKE
jgi:phospholipid-binding lipoprotein MlaA